MTSVAAVAGVLLALALAGRGLLRLAGAPLPPDAAGRWLLWPLSGLLTLHLTLLALDLASVRWSLASVGLPLALLTLGNLRRPRPGAAPPARLGCGWGDAVALAGVLVLALVAWQRWSVHADFVYHWGVKGQRFFLAAGIDYDFLRQPWNAYAHPDYPQLLPGLYAVTALARGGWDEQAMLLWSPLQLLGLVLAARSGLAAAGVTRAGTQAGVAAVAAALAMIGVGYRLSGGADWLIALALAAAAPALLAPGSAGHRVALAVAAAVAAGAKVEGAVLAMILLAASSLAALKLAARPGWRWPSRRDLGWQVLLALPAAAVILPWLLQSQRHDLFSPPQLGAPQLASWTEVLPALGQALAAPEWHGVAFLLLLLPLLVAVPAVRGLTLVTLAQLGFYLVTYLATREGAAFWVLTSFPRLAVHLLPATLLAACVALDRWACPEPSSSSS